MYEIPSLDEVKAYAEHSLGDLWDEYKRILNPEAYPVDLSQALYDLKMDSIHKIRKRVKENLKRKN